MASCDGTTPCTCEPSDSCINPIPNTIACANALPPSIPNRQYTLQCADASCSTCTAGVECSVRCDPATSEYNSLTDTCEPFVCDASTLPANGPNGEPVVTCASTPSQVDEPYGIAADQTACDTANNGCVYFFDCG